jgi:hypothetical protein
MKNVIIEATTILQEQYDPPITAVYIDMTRGDNKALEAKMFGGMAFYPSVTFRQKGKKEEFLEASTESSPQIAWLLNQLRRATLPPGSNPAVTLENESDVWKLTVQQKAVVIGMYSDMDSKMAKHLQSIAGMGRLAHVAFGVTTSREVMGMFDCRPNSLIVINNHTLPTRIIEMTRKAMNSISDHIQFITKSTMSQFQDFRPWAKEYQNVLRPGTLASTHIHQARANGEEFSLVGYLIVDQAYLPDEVLYPALDAYMRVALRYRERYAHIRPTILSEGVPTHKGDSDENDDDVKELLRRFAFTTDELPALVYYSRKTHRYFAKKGVGRNNDAIAEVAQFLPAVLRNEEGPFCRSAEASLGAAVGWPDNDGHKEMVVLDDSLWKNAVWTNWKDKFTQRNPEGKPKDTLLLIYDPASRDPEYPKDQPRKSDVLNRTCVALNELTEHVHDAVVKTETLQFIRMSSDNSFLHSGVQYLGVQRHRTSQQFPMLYFFPADKQHERPIQLHWSNNMYYILEVFDCHASHHHAMYEFSSANTPRARREGTNKPESTCSHGWKNDYDPESGDGAEEAVADDNSATEVDNSEDDADEDEDEKEIFGHGKPSQRRKLMAEFEKEGVTDEAIENAKLIAEAFDSTESQNAVDVASISADELDEL